MRANRFVESYIDAWNRHNPEGVADHLARNGIYCDIPENAERTHDELVESLEAFFSQFRHRYELAGEVLTTPDAVAFQYRMIPTSDDAQESIHHGAEFITLTSDGALLIRDYYNVPDIGRQPVTSLATSSCSAPPKYAKSGLSHQDLVDCRQRLERLIRTRRVYVQPDLTLPKLSRMLDCSVNHLSQVINAGFGVSFFDYLNGHRIDDAKRLLTQSDSEDQPVMNIAYAVGFNSSSAFYAAFRKHTGQTPARYRRLNRGNGNR